MPCERPAVSRNIVNLNEMHNAPQMIPERHTITHLARTIPDTWSSIQ